MNASRNHTTRHPVTDSNISNFDELDKALNKEREPKVQAVLDLLEIPPYFDYRNFASTGARTKRVVENGKPVVKIDGPSGSLENFHNNYHVTLGGQGHMSRVPVAAFDPVFWLHHWLGQFVLHYSANAYTQKVTLTEF